MKKKNLLNAKVMAIMGAALAAITGVNGSVKAAALESLPNNDANSTEFKTLKRKPMPVLKLNIHNVEDSKFVASHVSHASHRSHYSHYSHRSGAMFN
jgi:hypothetical protein